MGCKYRQKWCCHLLLNVETDGHIRILSQQSNTLIRSAVVRLTRRSSVERKFTLLCLLTIKFSHREARCCIVKSSMSQLTALYLFGLHFREQIY